MSLIYRPQEDSFLLREVLENKLYKKNISILEIGSGSGVQLEALKKLGIKDFLGVDINEDAVTFCKSKNLPCIKSDLFSNIDRKFDLIIFNPPYLPEYEEEDEESKLATTGGIEGSELINRFLTEAKNCLNDKGRIFLLISSLTKGINWLDYKKKLIAEKKLFFEKLEVWELRI